MDRNYAIAFTTHAYWKDWENVTYPKRLTVIIGSHCHPFTQKILVINNIHDHQHSNVEHKVKKFYINKSS